MSDISKKSNKIKVRLPLNESIKIKDDGTPDWDAMDPETKAKFMADLRDYFRAERAEFSGAADDGEDLYDLENDNYHNPHEDDENWDLNSYAEEYLDDFRAIPDSDDYEEAIYESLNDRQPITFREYTRWNEYGDGYSKRYGDYDDEGDLYEEDDFDDTDEYVDGLNLYDDSPLENEELYGDEDDLDDPETEEIDGSEIDDSSVIYPEDDDLYDDEQPEFYEDPNTGRQWYEKREVRRPFQIREADNKK